jgi:hypothetical protein
VLTFKIRNRDTGEVKIDDPAGDGSADGFFEYAPTVLEVNTAGVYQCQIKIQYPDDSGHYTLLLDLRILANL